MASGRISGQCLRIGSQGLGSSDRSMPLSANLPDSRCTIQKQAPK